MPAHLELTPAWRSARAELRRTVGDSTFDIWLAPLTLQDWDGTTLTLAAPAGTRAWVSNRFGRVLERCAQTSFGPGVKVELTEAPGTAQYPDTSTQPEQRDSAIPDHRELERFIPRHTFDQFIIGDGNRLAHAAALAVAEAPAQAYNPLFLYAPPGLGKTHLLHAIGNYISTFDPGTTVRYTTVEAFTNGFLSALSTRSVDSFKHLYRDVDVLLIDDVQFLASKAKTEEEFFHTFNALYDTGRQLVLTADRLPRELTGIEARLRARFESGLVAQLAPPNRATRVAILRKRAALDRIHLPDSTVLDLIADRVTDNIRSLEGALIRVIAHHSLSGRPLDTELAAHVLDDLHPATANPAGDKPTVETIQDIVATHFGLSRADLLSHRRTAHVAWPRQLAISLARELTDAPLQVIGESFGGRNHATVLHACKRVSNRVSTNPEDAAELTALRSLLTAAASDRSS
ncbi:MAG: chromosomal replication initiator protein DnaA [Solirubrobacterales bacterium]|nr:chromosomal replication initiator protein DnaA [Solirubrobacterales bacterium]